MLARPVIGESSMTTTAEHDPVLALALSMPKAELHVHIEGTLEPELMFALGQRIGKPQSGLSRNMRSEPAILLPGERRAEGRS